jgi:hypothetical protein
MNISGILGTANPARLLWHTNALIVKRDEAPAFTVMVAGGLERDARRPRNTDRRQRLARHFADRCPAQSFAEAAGEAGAADQPQRAIFAKAAPIA